MQQSYLPQQLDGLLEAFPDPDLRYPELKPVVCVETQQLCPRDVILYERAFQSRETPTAQPITYLLHAPASHFRHGHVSLVCRGLRLVVLASQVADDHFPKLRSQSVCIDSIRACHFAAASIGDHAT